MLASRKMTQTIGGRRWSIATMDLMLTGAFSDVDPVAVGWIERIELTTHASIEGIALAFPPNSGPETIPPFP
jgi:hypothetical protein